MYLNDLSHSGTFFLFNYYIEMVFYYCPGELGRNRKNFYIKVITSLFVDDKHKQIFRGKNLMLHGRRGRVFE